MNKEAAGLSSETPPPTYDESIIASTDSDSLSSWTLVSGKSKSSLEEDELDMKATNNRIEILKGRKDRNTSESETDEDQQNKSPVEEIHANDEFSDGVSVISESDAGELSDHPNKPSIFENIHLKNKIDEKDEFDCNLRGPTLDFSKPFNKINVFTPSNLIIRQNLNEIRERRRSSPHMIETIKEMDSSIKMFEMPSIVRNGLTGAFYIGATLAILAFIGKLRYPEWEPLSNNHPMAGLEQKITHLELQNNLMRAEIDILSKQVNYLSNLNEQPYQRGDTKGMPQHSQYQQRSKHWNTPPNAKIERTLWNSGKESASPSPNDIPPSPPGQCVDGKIPGTENICTKGDTPTSNTGTENEHNDVWEESETFKAFEKVVEAAVKVKPDYFKNQPSDRFPGPQTGPTSDHQPTRPGGAASKEFGDKWKYQKDFKHSSEKYNSKEHGRYKKHEYKNRKSKEFDDSHEDDDDDDDDDDDSNEKFKKRHSKERNSKERNFKERNSKEKFDKQRYGGNNSKERFDRNRKKFSEDFKKDAQWHEKLMQQRENARVNNKDNWYLERGGSREQVRDIHQR